MVRFIILPSQCNTFANPLCLLRDVTCLLISGENPIFIFLVSSQNNRARWGGACNLEFPKVESIIISIRLSHLEKRKCPLRFGQAAQGKCTSVTSVVHTLKTEANCLFAL